MESNRKQTKFKIGDKVTVTGCRAEGADDHIYTVVSIDPMKSLDDEHLYRLEREDGICGWWWEDKIKLAPVGPHGNIEIIKVQSEYERGLDDAWEVVRQLRSLKLSDLVEIFDKDCTSQIIEELSASEAVTKWKAWKEQNELKVGDEVILNANANHGNEKVVVLADDGSNRPYNVLINDGNTEWVREDAIERKTGRHFDAIEEILNQIQWS